jgi:hypothetical protein
VRGRRRGGTGGDALSKGDQLGSESVHLILVLLTDFAMLSFEIIQRLSNNVELVDLRRNCLLVGVGEASAIRKVFFF